VVHSGTKYMGGHGDLCCGAVVASRDNAQRIRALACHLGGSMNATECYLLERSLKTMALRVERQSENAMAMAARLSDHPRVKRVYYPGLPESPGHEIARSQMRGYGGMLSFDVDERTVDPDRFVRSLKLVQPAVSLGGVETTICSPAATSHAPMSVEERERIGITRSLFRLSVGIEHVDDLTADLDQALMY